jgi:hypothetical protein
MTAKADRIRDLAQELNRVIARRKEILPRSSLWLSTRIAGNRFCSRHLS